MTKNEYINYWIDSSEKDYITMKNLLSTQDYHWCLFIGHLVIEKLLKALYVLKKDKNIPKIHDLSRLCELSEINISEELEDILDLITTFNINARYPDYKNNFYSKCTKEFTLNSLKKIEEARNCILEILKKK